MRYKLVCHFEMTDNLVISSLKELDINKLQIKMIYISMYLDGLVGLLAYKNVSKTFYYLSNLLTIWGVEL